MSVDIRHGDSRDVLKSIADASIDSCVTDPPYALVSIAKRWGKPGQTKWVRPDGSGSGVYTRATAGFMGQQWDTGETAFDPAFWAEVLRVLKPGAHLLAFSGTRTQHRMVCAIEDAGFEIRDQIGWAFGSGFPKSHTLTGKVENYDGWGTALKPAWEPICVARKPLTGTVAANVMAHGTGAINVDGCRIETADGYAENAVTQGINTAQTSYAPAVARRTFEPSGKGRWPANLVHDGSDDVLAGFPETKSGSLTADQQVNGGFAGTLNCHGKARTGGTNEYAQNSGSAARFFYTAKADKADRLGSKHPTVKPVDLMRWLCRLVTPPGGTVLDPFAGSGSTGMACLAEGFNAILIEREADFVADIKRRVAHVSGEDAPLFAFDPTTETAAGQAETLDTPCADEPSEARQGQAAARSATGASAPKSREESAPK